MTTLQLPQPDPTPIDPISSTTSIDTTSATPNSMTVTIHHALAINDFEANDLHELALQEQDVVTIVHFATPGRPSWLFGKNGAQWGWFPANHVEMLSEEQSEVERRKVVNLGGWGALGFRGWGGFAPGGGGGVGGGGVGRGGEGKESGKGANKQPNTNPKNPTTPKRNPPRTPEDPITFATFLRSSSPTSPPTTLDSPRGSLTGLPPHAIERTPSKYLPSFLRKDSKSGLDSSSAPPRKSSTSRPSPVGRVEVAMSAVRAPDPTWEAVYGGGEKGLVEKLGLGSKDVARQNAIYEFEMSERRYMERMKMVVENFYTPIKEFQFMRPKDIDQLFANLPQIVKVSDMVVQIFEKARTDHGGYIQNIGELFLAMCPWLKLYATYCHNQANSRKKLISILDEGSALSRFMSEQQNQPCMEQKRLSDYLLEPMQRICRYPLLLQSILSKTETTHPDYEGTSAALSTACVLASIADQGEKAVVAAEEMILLQKLVGKKINVLAPHRELIASLDDTSNLHLLVGPHNKPQSRHLFLFNDMILIATPRFNTKTGTVARYSEVNQVPLSMVLINSVGDGGEYANSQLMRAAFRDLKNLIDLVHVGSNRYLLRFPSSDLKQTWLKHLDQATSFYVERSRRAQEPVTVVESSPVPAVETVEHPPAVLEGGVSGATLVDADSGGEGGFTEKKEKIHAFFSNPEEGSVRLSSGFERTVPIASAEREERKSGGRPSVGLLKPSREPLHERKTSVDGGVEGDAATLEDDLDAVIVKDEVDVDPSTLPFMRPQTIRAFQPSRIPIASAALSRPVGTSIRQPGATRSTTPLQQQQRLTRSIENLSSNPAQSFTGRKRPSLDITLQKPTYKDPTLESLSTRPFVRTLVKSLDNLSASTPSPPITPLGNKFPSSRPAITGSTPILSLQSPDGVELPQLPKKPAPKVPGQKPLVGEKPGGLRGGYRAVGYGRYVSVGVDGEEVVKDGRRVGVGRTTGTRSVEGSREELDSLKDVGSGGGGVGKPKVNLSGMTGRISSNPFIVQDVGSVRGGGKRESGGEWVGGRKGRVVGGGGVHARAATADVSGTGALLRQSTVTGLPTSRLPKAVGVGWASNAEQTDKEVTDGGVHTRARTHDPTTTTAAAAATSPTKRAPPPIHQKPLALKSPSTPTMPDMPPEKAAIPQNPTTTAPIPVPPFANTKIEEEETPTTEKTTPPTATPPTTDDLIITSGKAPPEASLPKRAQTIQARMRHRRSSSASTRSFDSPTPTPEGASVSEESKPTVADFAGISVNQSSYITPPSIPRDASLSDLVRLLEGGLTPTPQTGKKAAPAVNRPVKRATILEVVRQSGNGGSAGMGSNTSSATKSYVYWIQVQHSGDPPGKTSIIRHTYEDFFDFHLKLLGHFPAEGGVALHHHPREGDSSDVGGSGSGKLIPELPMQTMYVSDTVAKARIVGLQVYIEGILALPARISRSPVVMGFFRGDGKHAEGGSVGVV
ncbi:hypothetical protein HDV00_003479 [Rhizophlyctis rosea]|nr:hypothetical protein HDV00_003479 [Rhizophlyctis rosea]